MKNTFENYEPAFPATHADGAMSGGMTIREYFAAHAPAEIPEWFDPVGADLPSEISRDEIAQRCNGVGNLFNPDTGYYEFRGDPQGVARANAELREQHAIFSKRLQARKIARIAQWPWFYADQVLAASGIAGGEQ